MNNLLVTNILLTIIAVLLLVDVIQDSKKPGMRKAHPSMMDSGSSSATQNRSVRPGATEMGHSMFFQALSAFPEGCEGMKVLAECNSPAAQVVKKEILEQAEGRGPRAVFDFVIEKYGMDALTPQAKRIRRMRTGQ